MTLLALNILRSRKILWIATVKRKRLSLHRTLFSFVLYFSLRWVRQHKVIVDRKYIVTCYSLWSLSSTCVLQVINPLKPELNSVGYLLALLAHHFLHVCRIRVKSLTFRRLMSYIYIYMYIWSTHSWCF